MAFSIRNNKGFSLIEIITSLVIVSIAMLGVTTLLYVASAYSFSLNEEFQALSNSYRMEYQLRKYVSMAIRVVGVGGRGGDNRIGEFRAVNCLTIAACPNTTWQEVALFNREYSTGGLDADVEKVIMPTWIWYKSPIHSPANTGSSSGILVIDTGAGAGPAGDPRHPTNPGDPAFTTDDEYFDQISSFQTVVSTYDGLITSPVSRVTFNTTFRYHGVTAERSWCSITDISNGNCNFASGDIANYYDNDYSFSISLVNNMLKNNINDGSGLEVRILGPFHMFRPILPVEDL